jgi:hypothetical protein
MPDHQLPSVPIDSVVKPRAQARANPEMNGRRTDRRALAVDELRLIMRQVNDVRCSWKNLHWPIVIHHRLFGSVRQVAKGLRTGAQALDRIEHILRLSEEGLSKRGGPRQVIIHPLQNGGIPNQCEHTGIPPLLGSVIGSAAVHQVAVSQDNFHGQS